MPDDVFHLLADEFVTGTAPDLRARVAYRKELAAGYESFDLPVLFVGTPVPIPRADDEPPAPVVIEALGVSPGVVEGIARVILDPAAGEPLEPGEILVCGATDPSWVGHFLVAAALVIDVGGPMSHGAIVAARAGGAVRDQHRGRDEQHPDRRHRPHRRHRRDGGRGGAGGGLVGCVRPAR